ncbi:MAG TPA: prolyl oligopeptidase family serine peptidase, partial [Nevskiaceae bacterium]|nr:prolyl oligopeptidase family serine peptidase [Nevskiaceae bacterium]
SGRFWYQRHTALGSEFVAVDAKTGKRRPAFDHAAVAAALNGALKLDVPASAQNLGLQNARLSADGRKLTGVAGNKAVTADLEAHSVGMADITPAKPGLLLSPTGTHGLKRAGDNLVLVDLASASERRLTEDGAPYYSYGKLPDSGLQTIPLKKSGAVLPPYGAAFSPDGRFLICPRIDERRLGVDPFVEHVPTDGSLRPVVHEVRHSYTGDQAQMVTDWFVFEVKTGSRHRIQLPLGSEPSAMLGNGVVGWSLQRQQVFILATTAASRSGALFRVDLATGAAHALIDEAATTCRYEPNTLMYNMPNVYVTGDGAEVIWYSDRTGWGHLYRYDAQTGELLGQITGGNWMVFDIHHVDAAQRTLYFTAGGREAGVDPYYRHLYRVGFDGSGLMLLTGGELRADHVFAPNAAPLFKTLFGVPDAADKIRPAAGVFVDTYSTVDTPPVTVLRSLHDGTLIAELERADVSALLDAGYRPPSRQLLKADDGKTDIPVVYYPPAKVMGKGAHPVIDACYGGPQVYVAPRAYAEAAASSNPANRSAMSRLGFGVAVVDGRGTPGRGNAFRDAGFPNFTEIGIRDHVAAIRQLAAQHPELDISRVGIHGWSWGGTFSAQAILAHGDFYSVCVTGAGVYDYAALYPGFESSIGMPVYADGTNHPASVTEKPPSWDRLDITKMVDGLSGKMMIVWGDADENVPPVQAYRLIEALIKANKPYDALILPNKTHPSASQSLNPYTAARTWDYFVRHLLASTPPVAQPFQIQPRRVMQ